MSRRLLSPLLVAWVRNRRMLSISSVSNEVSSPSLLSQPVSSAPDTIYLTENCIQKMKELQSSEPEKNLLRLGVDSGGCAGYTYVFQLDSTTNSDDRVFEKDGVKLVVDSASYDRVRGATVDYKEELISSAFVVAKNPKAKGGCGCHKSFTFIE